MQISSRASVDMYVKTALILSGLVVSFYGTFFCFSGFWVSVPGLVQTKAVRGQSSLVSTLASHNMRVGVCSLLLSVLWFLVSVWQR